MLTKDSVTIMVDAVVYYRVFNPIVNLTQVEDANVATQMIAQTTLRNMLGTKSLAELLMDREEMAEQMEVGEDPPLKWRRIRTQNSTKVK